MRTPTTVLLALIISFFSSVSQGAENSIDLLQGEDLDHWYTWIKDRGRDSDPKGVFTQKDGILRISGEENGHIATEEEYGDYHLLVEYQWGPTTFAPRVDMARDSGILIHSVGTDGDYQGTFMHAIIVQLIEGGSGDLLVLGDGSDAYSLTSPVAEAKQGSETANRHIH